MFAYCLNDPVNRIDVGGSKSFKKEDEINDVDKHFNDVTGGGGGYYYCVDLSLAARSPIMSGGVYNYGYVHNGYSASVYTQSQGTAIYRYGGTNPGNLTPKEKDQYSGLSFSTVPKPGSAMTTIEALNSTGVVYAVQDSATHVSVRPRHATVKDWIDAGSSSVWTQAVKAVVVKWKGN